MEFVMAGPGIADLGAGDQGRAGIAAKSIARVKASTEFRLSVRRRFACRILR